jgi:hypothetical protein
MPTHISNNLTQVNGNNGSVAVSANTSVVVRPANAGRLQVWITNACNATAYINLGATAVSGTGIPLAANASVTLQTYGGAISAISTGTGSIIYAEV